MRHCSFPSCTVDVDPPSNHFIKPGHPNEGNEGNEGHRGSRGSRGNESEESKEGTGVAQIWTSEV